MREKDLGIDGQLLEKVPFVGLSEFGGVSVLRDKLRSHINSLAILHIMVHLANMHLSWSQC